VPTFTAVLLLESTWIERVGPPRIVTEALPFTWNDGLAVLCNTTRGTGVFIAYNPQPAEAVTFTSCRRGNFREVHCDRVCDSHLYVRVNDCGKAGRDALTPVKLDGKLTLTLDPRSH